METGVPQRIEGTTSNLYFNDWTDAHAQGGLLQITGVTGADGAEVRAPVDQRPQRDGGIIHAFYRGPRYFTLEGRIVADTTAERATLEDRLRGVTQQILRADGRYVFQPSGQSERFITCRLAGPVEISDENSATKTFAIPLVSEDPIAVSYAEVDTTIAAGGSATIHNGGNADDWPVFEVNGPFTDFTITNNTSGESIVVSGATLVGSGHWLEVITFRESIFKDGDQDNYAYAVDWANTDFFTLAPGDNNISFVASGGAGTASLVVKSNDAWV